MEETLKKFDSLKLTPSFGTDGISNRLVKSLKFQICVPFTKLANNTLELGIFSTVSKQGKVTPIDKKGNKYNASIFRPISLMNNIDKLLELLVLMQVE